MNIVVKASLVVFTALGISSCIGNSNADAFCPSCNSPIPIGNILIPTSLMVINEGITPPNPTSKRIEIISSNEKYFKILEEYGQTPTTNIFVSGKWESFIPDFSKENILLYDLGRTELGNYSLAITSVIDHENYAVVNVEISKPKSECATANKISNRFKFIHVSNKKVLLFSETISEKDCGV